MLHLLTACLLIQKKQVPIQHSRLVSKLAGSICAIYNNYVRTYIYINILYMPLYDYIQIKLCHHGHNAGGYLQVG